MKRQPVRHGVHARFLFLLLLPLLAGASIAAEVDVHVHATITRLYGLIDPFAQPDAPRSAYSSSINPTLLTLDRPALIEGGHARASFEIGGLAHTAYVASVPHTVWVRNAAGQSIPLGPFTVDGAPIRQFSGVHADAFTINGVIEGRGEAVANAESSSPYRGVMALSIHY